MRVAPKFAGIGTFRYATIVILPSQCHKQLHYDNSVTAETFILVWIISKVLSMQLACHTMYLTAPNVSRLAIFDTPKII